MPELHDLERLKSEIIHLADEPAILEKRNIRLPDIHPPEQEEDQELSQLLEGFGEEFGGEAEEFSGEDIGEDTGEAAFREIEPPAGEESEGFPAEISGEGFDESAGGGFEGEPDRQFEEEPGPVVKPLEELEEFPLEDFDLESLDEEGPVVPLEPEEVISDVPSLEEGFETVGGEEEFGFGEVSETGEQAVLDEQLEEFPGAGETSLSEDLLEPAKEEFTLDEFPGGLEEIETESGKKSAEEGIGEEAEEEDFSLPEEFELDEDLFGEGEIPDFSAEQEIEETGPEEGEVEAPLPDLGMEEFEEPEIPEPGVEGEEIEPGEIEDLEESIEEFEMPGGELEGSVEEFEMPEEEIEAEGEEGQLEELELPQEEFEEGEFEIDEFNLGDLGEEFGVLEEGEQEIIEGPEEVGLPVSEEEAPIELTEEEFKIMGETLQTLPRNLKLIIEEQIGEQGLAGPSLRTLIEALVKRKSPKEIAQITSKITGRRIRIPSQYEKRTGAAFEAEKESFAYAFRYRIFPMLRTILLSAAVVALFIFLGIRFIYRPLYALHLYNQGFEQLEQREFISANTYFRRGLEQKIMRKQFFRYAEGFEEMKQWTLAEEKYETLLQYYPYDKEGTLSYAGLELKKLSNYQKASDILSDFLEEEPRDYEASLLLGDTYLEWGSEDPEKFEQARFQYAVLMENYGVSDLLLFRMLRYFIRTDNQDEVLNLKDYYEIRPKVEVDPEAFTELGGYLIDKNRLGDVRQTLLRAKAVDDSLPETHYHLARYFGMIEERQEEEKALRYTLNLMQNISPLTRKRIELKVDTHRRFGELLYSQGKYLDARAQYNRGIKLYEDSLNRKLIEVSPQLGMIYADLGDLHYYQSGEYDEAGILFSQAESNGYDSPAMKYKQGFISYWNEDYRSALLKFQRSAGAFSTNRNLMFATANTLFKRGNFQSSQGYYAHLSELLEQELEREVPLLIDERRDHQALVENLMRTSNNLGVTYYNLYKKTGIAEYYSLAMVQFSESSRYFDRLTRDPDTLERTGLSNLAYVNQRNLLYPQRQYELQIYTDIPLDMNRLILGL